jgi:tetratricopeptide (TPR) repeat protein
MLAEIRESVNRRDREIVALYFHAFGVACVKARRFTEGFKAFETAMRAGRAYGDAALCAKMLNNYGTAALQMGSVETAIACLEEALESHRRSFSSSASVRVGRSRPNSKARPTRGSTRKALSILLMRKGVSLGYSIVATRGDTSFA